MSPNPALTSRGGSNRRFEFHKRSELFIRAQDETLSVAVRVNNPDCAPFPIHWLKPHSKLPMGSARMVRDFQVLHPSSS